MLAPFDLLVLAWPALAIATVTAAATLIVTRSPLLALAFGALKAGLFVLYFGALFDGTFTLLDDMTYLRESTILVERGVSILTLRDDWQLLSNIAVGPHFAYYLFNIHAMKLFGIGYYAPVALNLIMTAFIAWWGCRIFEQEFRLSPWNSKVLFCFLLLYPNTLAWSTVMNLKDIFVLLLHVALLQGVAWIQRSRYIRAAIVIGAATLLAFFVRFYVPLFFAVSFAIAAVLGSHGRQRLRLTAFGVILLGVALFLVGPAMLQYGFEAVRADMSNPVYGALRALLTPIPFNTDAAYGFLDLPALFHWLMMPFAIIGGVVVYRMGTPFARFFVVYFLVFMGFYSLFNELQGPRHRLQLDLVWAMFQFVGVIVVMRALNPSPRRHSPEVVTP